LRATGRRFVPGTLSLLKSLFLLHCLRVKCLFMRLKRSVPDNRCYLQQNIDDIQAAGLALVEYLKKNDWSFSDQGVHFPGPGRKSGGERNS
jgi:hypothetical protein